MALPHPLDVHGGVPNPKGFNVDEFFYGCYADITDGPPGSGSRGISPEEDATTYITNRAAYALAENDEYLYSLSSAIMDQALAVVEVGALDSYAGGDQIVIDPSGGATGDINYTGSLYMGEAGWVDNQENRDTLFQFLDENYNEVIVDGVEVKIASFALGGAMGQGFRVLATGLKLNKVVPAGDYRLAFGKGSTLGTLPPYSLIRADVRGLHEAPGEAAKQSVIVVDPDPASTRPADYKGATALQDALDASGDNKTIFLRAGAYTVHMAGAPANPLSITNNWITIVGEGRGPTLGVILTLQAGHDLTVSGTGIKIENVRIESSDSGRGVHWTGDHGAMDRCYLTELKLEVDGVTNGSFSNMRVGADGRSLYVHGGTTRCSFQNITCLEGTGVPSIVQIGNDITSGASHCTFRNISAEVGTTNSAVACLIDQLCTDLYFEDCIFTGGTAPGFATPASNVVAHLTVDACTISSDTGPAIWINGVQGAVIRNCTFACLTGFTSGIPLPGGDNFIRVGCLIGPEYAGSKMENCYFDLHGVEATDDTDVHLIGMDASGLSFNYTTGFDGTQPGITLQSGTFRDVEVDFGSSRSNMNNDMEAIVVNYARVDRIRVFSVFGDWFTSSVIGIYGSSSLLRGEVRDIYIETDTTTTNDAPTPLVRVHSYVLVGGWTWSSQDINDTNDVSCLIGVGSENSLQDVTIRDLDVNLGDYADDFDAVIFFLSSAASLTAKRIWIENCYIDCCGSTTAIRPWGAIRFDDGTAGAIQDVWITKCHIDYGLVDGTGEVTSKCPIWADSVKNLFVVDNYITADIPSTPDNGDRKFVYNDLGTGGSTSTGLTYATMVHQNVMASKSSDAPYVGNGTQSNDAAFFNFVANNLVG